ncbi:MAG: hypothetical protein COA44_09015 [Arcobacter sp.]|nr:MAG: hypothetical protein COA44_09015 [Arcobacter sp.]
MSLNNAHEGYDYQDILTCYFILQEILLGNVNSIFSIDKKHTTGDIPDRFDDLVITNGLTIKRKQIKYSNDTVAKKLTKSYLSSDSPYSLAIHKLYETWKELNTEDSEFRLCLAWDEATDSDITRVLDSLSHSTSSFQDYSTKSYKINLDNLWEENPKNFNRWDSLKAYVETNHINRTDFKKFCDELIIEVELPKASLDFSAPSYLENILYQQAEKLGISQYPNDDININQFLIIFAKKVGEYRTRSAEVSVSDVLRDLGVKTDFGKIEQKFEIDQTKNIINNSKYTLLESKVIEYKKTLLIGEPGSGKSWFLTNFIEHLKNSSKKVIRHYCYTATEDNDIEKRVSSDVFFGNLIADIINEFPNLLEVKGKLYTSDLDELNLLLTHVHHELIIVIDGLDHIDRVLKSSSTLAEDKTKIIESISKINLPENIFIVLGSQPVSEINTLIEKFEYVKYKIPKWNIEDTVELMGKYSLENTLLNTKPLSEYIFEKCEANPLYLTYIIRTLLHENITVNLIEELPKYDFNLKSYYEYLTEQIDENLTSEILSCLEFSVTKEELRELIPRSHHIDNNLKILSPVIVENISRGGIKLYHDSFRRFNIEKLELNTNLEEVYSDIAKWLKKKGFYKNAKSYRYLLKYYIKLKKYKKIKRYATNDFLTKSLYRGYSENVIKINYTNFLYTARETQDWPLYIYISELNRTIYTTLSEDYHSEFLTNFELYFEAIGLIYGFDTANKILFFDGEKTFSNEITAKAFYISQINGYIPNWSILEDYFETDIPLEDYHYFISSLIASETELVAEFKELLDPEYKDFFQILIKEVSNQIGFNKILELYDSIQADKKQQVASLINKVLNRTKCQQRILVTVMKRHLVLEELNLDFVNDYLEIKNLKSFFLLVNMYASYNIEALRNFEKTIPSKNFFYNWIKFRLRNIIIENDLNNSKFKNHALLEEVLVENFELLASDIEPFKDKPRAIDLTREHSFIIKQSIEHALMYIKSSHSWEKTIKSLERISFGTMGYLNNTQMGILPYGLLIDILLNNLNEVTENFILNVINNIEQKDENYNYYCEYKLKKAIAYSKLGRIGKAKKALKIGSRYLTSYTFHKDRTLEEIIEPLSSINTLDNKFAKKYTKKLKYLTDAVMKHTDDNKGTRWLTTEWFKEFLKVDDRLSSIYLIDQLLNSPYFWKLDYMFVYYIQHSNNVNPIILNFLFRLTPVNTNNDYINSFSDNINFLIPIDRKTAKQSLINILARDLNNSYDSLSVKTTQKLQVLKNLLNVSLDIKQEENSRNNFSNIQNSLRETVDKSFDINRLILSNKTIDEINKYFEKKDDLSDKNLNTMFFYLSEKNDDQLVIAIVLPLIQKRLLSSNNYFEQLRHLVNSLSISNNTKIFLLVHIYVYSKDDWYSQFVNKQALKDAVQINPKETLDILSQSLFKMFSNFGYGSKSTANLIIAFEYAGLKKEDILSMYQTGFESIEYRLPDDNDFRWKDIKSKSLELMNEDELAIVVILVKITNLDSFVQKEIVFAINYIFIYDSTLLIKPFKWFFQHIKKFPEVSIAALLEIFLLQENSNNIFFKALKIDIKEVKINNLYIQNILRELVERTDNV